MGSEMCIRDSFYYNVYLVVHPSVLRSFRPARVRGQHPLIQTIMSPASWHFLSVWNMHLTFPCGFPRARIQGGQSTMQDTCMQALFTLLQAPCLPTGPGMCHIKIRQPTIPQRPSHDNSHHTSTWGGGASRRGCDRVSPLG